MSWHVSSSPELFAQAVLGLEIYPWQAMIAEAVDQSSELDRVRLAIRTPNGSGKSSVVIPLMIIRWLDRYPRSKVVLTSADSRQLDSQLMRALNSYRNPNLLHWEFMQRAIRTPEGGLMLGFTTDEPARMEGHHGRPGAPLLMIVDEAKSVPEEIFQAIDRCGYSVLVLISSGGLRSGTFYDAFSSRRANHLCFEIGLGDCPHISQSKVKDMIATYGEDHPLTRSSIYGEFMDTADGHSMIVAYEELLALLTNPPGARLSKEERSAFCDFAVSRDENVLAIRCGNKLEQLVCFHASDSIGAVGRFIMEFRRWNLRPTEIWGDAGGLGLPFCDMLRDAGWPINRFNFGERASNDDHFTSRGSELWHSFAMRVRKGEIVLLNDPVLISQLTSRKTTVDMRGRLGIEKKEDMASRGLKSPDRADAVIGAFGHGGSGYREYARRMDSANDGWWRQIDETWEVYDRVLGENRTEARERAEEMGSWTG